MKRTWGCFAGGFVGFLVFVAWAIITNLEKGALEASLAPLAYLLFGGLFLIPFLLVFALIGATIGWFLESPITLPTLGDLGIWGKGCLAALTVCALIISALWLIAHYLA